MRECEHNEVVRGRGSTHFEMMCVNCREPLGMSISIESAKWRINTAELMLKIAKENLIEAEKWATWVAAHPGVVVP